MKILIATGIYPPDIGGPAKYSKNLTDEFLNLGHQVKVLSYKLEKKLPVGVRHFWYYLRVIRNINKVDLIIALDMFSTGFPAVLAGVIFHKKIVLRIGGDFLWETYVDKTKNLVHLKDFYKYPPKLSIKFKLIKYWQKFTIKHANALVFNSCWQKDLFAKIYNLEQSKLFVIENFYGEKNNSSEPKNKNFLFAGRQTVFKNLDLLKEVFVELNDEGYETNLEIVDNLSSEQLQKKICESYAVITVSITDFAPNFIVEAITCGKPFILTNECGLVEKVGNLGLIVNPEDKLEIKQAIRSLLNEDVYEKYKNNIINFQFTHSWQEMANEFLGIYKNL